MHAAIISRSYPIVYESEAAKSFFYEASGEPPLPFNFAATDSVHFLSLILTRFDQFAGDGKGIRKTAEHEQTKAAVADLFWRPATTFSKLNRVLEERVCSFIYTLRSVGVTRS